MTATTGDEVTLSRRHAAGAPSARGLLFTVLGELVLPTGGEAWTSAFIDVFGRLGVEEKAARQALMRTAADNWLTSERVGRRTVWRLTPAAERLLRDGTERIFGFTAVAADWDGRWTIVIARTPETERAARHVLRTRLREDAGGSGGFHYDDLRVGGRHAPAVVAVTAVRSVGRDQRIGAGGAVK